MRIRLSLARLTVKQRRREICRVPTGRIGRFEQLEDRRLLNADSWVSSLGMTDGFASRAVATDTAGNVYVASEPGSKITVTKLGPNGTHLWSKDLVDISNGYYPHARDLVVATDGSVYVAGVFQHSLDWNGDGIADLTTKGDIDVFAVKFDTGGNLMWGKSWGSDGQYIDEGHSLSLVGSQLLLSGRSMGNIDFDGYTVIKPKSIADGSAASWVASLDTSTGVAQWATGLNVADSLTSIAANDPGTGTPVAAYVTSSGSGSIFKLDAATGVIAWSESLSGYPEEIAIDGDGGLFVTGSFLGPQQFGNQTLMGGSDYENFVARLTDTGAGLQFEWANEVTTPGSKPDSQIRLSIDNGTVYASGFFRGDSANFSGAIALYRAIVPTESDVTGYLARYDAVDGSLLAAQTAGFSPRGLAVVSGTVYLTGGQERGASYPVETSGSTTPNAFLPTPTVDGERDIFVMKMDAANPVVRLGATPGTTVEAAGGVATVTLTATAHSADGLTQYTNIDWYSQQQHLGTGASLTVVLTPGRHEITASVTDSLGIVGVAGREVMVVENFLAPSNLTGAVVNGRVKLDWQDNSSSETGFEIERAAKPKGNRLPAFQLLATVGPNVTTYYDPAGQGTWIYRVRAFRAAETSSYTNEVQVTNNSPAPEPPTFAVADISVTEGNIGQTTARFFVVRSGDTSQSASVDYATADGTATAGSDYTALALATLFFAAGETSKAVDVQVHGDVEIEADETFFLNLSNAVGASIADGQAVATILNDDGNVNEALFVYDIRFESRRGGKDWRAVFEIRSDSNRDGVGTAADSAAIGVTIRVRFNGIFYEGTTDERGEFRTSWASNLIRGDYYANVDKLEKSGYDWNSLLDLEDDSDGDGKPDGLLQIS